MKKIEQNLFEIRVKSIDKILRGLYFQIENNNYYITHGFIKKQQKTPRREITRSKKIRQLYQERSDRNE